ncbi:MAG: beta-galactosidase trimerization domain-containing protein [Acidobacteria bacterium]|nr:beta-galactosidase trimerization domain-containing protein [Acidobacteriota bacterium]
MKPTRRNFIIAAGAAAAVPAAAQYSTPPNWFDKPMRWAQLVFTEDDPGQYDAQFWLDYFKATHSDGACLAGGGYMAFYPTRIPLHSRSRMLGDRDPFGDLVKGCRKLGMAVIARTDPHAAHQDLYEAHPDWIAVDDKGQKRRHWANPALWVTCALGPMNFEFMTEVTKEIVREYGVDGVFSNRWAGSGMCYCEHCRRNFRQFSGLDLPRTLNPQDPARKAYLVWHEQRLFEVWRLWDSEIRKINPNARFIANSGGGALSELDMKTVGEMSDILFADRQARRGVMSAWSNGKNGKEYRAALGRKPIGGIFSVGIEEPYRWKDSVQDGEEIRLWAADGVANGLRPWFAKFNGKPYDKRWLKPVQQLYEWHYRNEKYLRNEANLARVAMVFSQHTAKFYGGEQAAAKVEAPIDGFYQALVESRIPFEMVHDRKLTPDEIGRFDVLILPNIAALSDAQCDQLRAYVRGGGSLIATHETSLYDEWGVRRKDFGLADVFGAAFEGKVDARVQNSYINLAPPHPLLRGLEDAGRIINGVSRVYTRSTRGGTAPMTLVPSYPDLPMEDVYPRIPRTDVPAVHIVESGKSRVIYFPWDIDRTFWEILAKDHLMLLRNSVEWALAGRSPVSVTGRGVLDVTVWRQRSSVTVHLVNLTNPMMMKGPVREVYPVGPQQVRLHAPGKAKSVRLCVAGRAVPFKVEGETIQFEIPSVEVHEMAAIDLA